MKEKFIINGEFPENIIGFATIHKKNGKQKNEKIF